MKKLRTFNLEKESQGQRASVKMISQVESSRWHRAQISNVWKITGLIGFSVSGEVTTIWRGGHEEDGHAWCDSKILARPLLLWFYGEELGSNLSPTNCEFQLLLYWMEKLSLGCELNWISFAGLISDSSGKQTIVRFRGEWRSSDWLIPAEWYLKFHPCRFLLEESISN